MNTEFFSHILLTIHMVLKINGNYFLKTTLIYIYIYIAMEL